MGRTLFIGNKNLSSWSLRPWLLMRQAGIAFEERLLRFEEPGWREDIRKYSPARTVPVLFDGELCIWDSLAIAEYLAEETPALWPADRSLRARARCVAAEMHSGFGSIRRELPFDLVGRVPGHRPSPDAEREIARILEIWNAKKGPFLFGDFSVADAMYAPVVYRFQTYGVALEGAAAEYSAAMLALPAMQEWAAGAASEERQTGMPIHSSAAHYWAVIFTSHLASTEGYAATAQRMEELAAKQPGYLGIESARGADGVGITVSYWDSLAAISAWKSNIPHLAAQARGKSSFYDRYEVRVCSVERGYSFSKATS